MVSQIALETDICREAVDEVLGFLSLAGSRSSAKCCAGLCGIGSVAVCVFVYCLCCGATLILQSAEKSCTLCNLHSSQLEHTA
jgi:hypothetical protein